MSAWNSSFYKSKAWVETRKAYLISKHYICERCEDLAKVVHHKIYITPENANDPYITLCHDNLEALCQRCHNAEHHGKPKATKYAFDDHGNIIYAPIE